MNESMRELSEQEISQVSGGALSIPGVADVSGTIGGLTTTLTGLLGSVLSTVGGVVSGLGATLSGLTNNSGI
ncbi:hypothetical protein [Pantoea cypripedii]|uniref:hypothetical protein n=1 Tax=Pantoea cypripedii TaxID=55209 RepID=UPI00111C1B8C|nr:hypothetical protein [Pantoea cypripedii]MBP2197341.1 hypothetical protein [Pantoea cypripedii]